MSDLAKTQTKLSEISVSPNRIASLSCHVEGETTLSLILHDELGRSCHKEDFPLTSGENQITFSISSLVAGSYNAWIDVMGKTYIRPLNVNGQKPTAGILDKFKEWLNFF